MEVSPQVAERQRVQGLDAEETAQDRRLGLVSTVRTLYSRPDQTQKEAVRLESRTAFFLSCKGLNQLRSVQTSWARAAVYRQATLNHLANNKFHGLNPVACLW